MELEVVFRVQIQSFCTQMGPEVVPRVQHLLFAVLENMCYRTLGSGRMRTGRLFTAGGSRYATSNTCLAWVTEYRTP